MADETRRDDGCPPPTRRDTVSGFVTPTRRDDSAADQPPTRRDGEEPRLAEGHPILLSLPRALATRYRAVEQLPTRGAEADLLIVEAVSGSERVVAKIYRPGIAPKADVLEKWKIADAEHIVRLYDHGESDGRAYELLEYTNAGSLHDLIQSEGPRLDVDTVHEIVRELAEILAYVHTLGLAHRDLKPANVLVRRRHPLDLVLTDFGIASIMDASSRFTSGFRTTAYGAPEAAAGIVTLASDFWSLGIVIAEVTAGRHPFADAAGGILADAVIGYQLATKSVDLSAVPEAWRPLCRGLLIRDPEKRFGKAEIDRWLQGDTTLRVPSDEEAITQVSYRPYKLAGTEYATPQQLAAGLAQHWQEGVKHLERGYIADWILKDVRNQELCSFLADLDGKSEYDGDGKLFRVLARFDSALQPTYMGHALTLDSMLAMATAASQAKPSLKTIIRSLYDGRILSACAAVEGSPASAYASLEQRWRSSVLEFERLARNVQQEGVAPPRLQVTDELLCALLSAVISDECAERIRAEVTKACTADALACPWFQSLGDMASVSPATLMLMHLAADAAEAHTRDRRAEERERSAWFAHTVVGAVIGGFLFALGGMIAGAITAYVPGCIVGLAIESEYGSKGIDILYNRWVWLCGIVGAGFGVYCGASKARRLRGQPPRGVQAIGTFEVLGSSLVVCVAIVLLVQNCTSAPSMGDARALKRQQDAAANAARKEQEAAADSVRKATAALETRASLERAAMRNPKDATSLNSLAWFLLTCESEGMRDPANALIYAQKAYLLMSARRSRYYQRTQGDIMDTLALALFRNGRTAEAVAMQESALATLNVFQDERREKMNERLAWYLAALQQERAPKASARDSQNDANPFTARNEEEATAEEGLSKALRKLTEVETGAGASQVRETLQRRASPPQPVPTRNKHVLTEKQSVTLEAGLTIVMIDDDATLLTSNGRYVRGAKIRVGTTDYVIGRGATLQFLGQTRVHYITCVDYDCKEPKNSAIFAIESK